MRALLSSLRQGLHRHGGALAWSGASQAISSLTTFGTTLYLVRSLDKPQFGLYGFALALTLLLAAPLGDFVSLQLVVNLPDRAPLQRASYAAHHGAAIALIGIAMIAAAAMFTVLAAAVWPIATALALPIATAAALYCGRDLLVRTAYCEHRESTAAASSVVVLTSVAAAFAAFAGCGIRIDAARALGVYGLGQGLGLAHLLLAMRLPFGSVHRGGLAATWRDIWGGGRWSICTSLFATLRSNTHTFVVGTLLGMAALADVNAARVLITPALLALAPFSQVLLPRLSARRGDGARAMLRLAALSTAALVAIALLYCSLLLLAAPWLLPFALGSGYADAGALLPLWCVVAVLMAARNGLANAMQAMRAFRPLMLLQLLATALSLALAAALCLVLGNLGALVGLAIAELLLCLSLLRQLSAAAPVVVPSPLPTAVHFEATSPSGH